MVSTRKLAGGAFAVGLLSLAGQWVTGPSIFAVVFSIVLLIPYIALSLRQGYDRATAEA